MIYLDNQATTPCDFEVTEAMMPYFSTYYGNASSGNYWGQLANDVIQEARLGVAQLLGGDTSEIVFTSGATESNNLALLGSTRAYQLSGGRRHKLITTSIEHKSVLAPISQLQKDGWEIIYLPVDRFGIIDLQKANELITEDAFLLSVQLANSEIGTIQPLAAITQMAKQRGVIIHCDAAQAFGKIEFKVDEIGVDLLSLSAHKIYGPKGIGALWINKYSYIDIQPIMFGGNPMAHIRPGTLPTPLIVGMGKACELSYKSLSKERAQTATLRDQFEKILIKNIPGLKINGSLDSRLPNNSNITFPGINAEALLANVPEVIASTGSACESGSIEPSRILLSIGLSREEAYNTIRFGLGRFTKQRDIEAASKLIIEVWSQLTH